MYSFSGNQTVVCFYGPNYTRAIATHEKIVSLRWIIQLSCYVSQWKRNPKTIKQTNELNHELNHAQKEERTRSRMIMFVVIDYVSTASKATRPNKKNDIQVRLECYFVCIFFVTTSNSLSQKHAYQLIRSFTYSTRHDCPDQLFVVTHWWLLWFSLFQHQSHLEKKKKEESCLMRHRSVWFICKK